jgi:hypothetical protein
VNLSRIRLLLAAWWCATVLPGLTVAVFFWDEAGDGGGAAVAVLIWIAGYVVQLVLFMAVGRQVKGVATSALLWFPVSLLPWAIDWGPGLGWAAETAFVLLALVIALYVLYRASGSSMLQANGVRATAVVLEVRKPLMNVVVNNIYIRRKLRVRVERDDQAPPYEATYSDLWELGAVPDPGDSFRVVLDPKRPQHLTALDDQGSAAPAAPPAPGGRGSSGRSTWRFTSWRNPAPAKPGTTYAPYSRRPARSPDTSAASTASVPGVVAAIRELAELHESGQLTDEEFAQAKRELLGSEDSARPE